MAPAGKRDVQTGKAGSLMAASWGGTDIWWIIFSLYGGSEVTSAQPLASDQHSMGVWYDKVSGLCPWFQAQSS